MIDFKICFVNSTESRYSAEDASALWFRYAAAGFGQSPVTAYECRRGLEPEADCYVVNRTLWDVPWQRWKARGARVICWFDDAFQCMPPISRAYTFWQRNMPIFKRLLGQIDGIITPNPILSADYAPYTPHAAYVPNYHARARVQHTGSDQARYGGGTLGWGGSSNHLTSWRDTGLYMHIPPRYEVRIVGYPQVAELIRPYNYVSSMEWFPDHVAYLKELAGWEACLIPVHGEYDRRRSWIKALECNLTGTPWAAVGDAIDIYRSVPYGARLLDLATLGDGLDQLFETYDCEAAQAWAEKQHIRYHLDEWREAICG